jgi:broad specificity phosphatase PhoE
VRAAALGLLPDLPARLWLVRHGQSSGNVAAAQATSEGRPLIEIADRDVDVGLSELGMQQAAALGSWFARQPPQERPTMILSSPYERAIQTARLAARNAGLALPPERFLIDERLRERELGMLNRLTKHGIVARYPEQAELRARLGKFYYRPPSGESWCDVILRLRSVTDFLHLRCRDERVLIVAHQAIVLCFRYLLEGMNEAQVLEVDAQAEVANCSVTAYAREADRQPMQLRLYNFVAPLQEGGAPVTHESDAPAAAR